MERQASRWAQDALPSAPSTELIRVHLIQLAGGDPAFEAKLREMIWQAYTDAKRPFGPTEDGMFVWLDQQKGLTV